jgi:ribosomal-protein-alanine N-acetyltransferase
MQVSENRDPPTLGRMVKLERLRADHLDALLAFERTNRAYFARSIPDRGDAYFAEFAVRLEALLAEQDAGVCHFHVVLDQDGELIGRMNLMDAAGGSAELGYRVGESAAGRGVATAAVREVCRLSATAYGLTEITARATLDNVASRTVLERNGFTVIGTLTLNDRPAVRYARVHL